MTGPDVKALRDLLAKATPPARFVPRDDCPVRMLPYGELWGPSWQVADEIYRHDAELWMAAYAALPELLRIYEAWQAAAEGEVVEVGDDDAGQPRALIHSTRDELRKGSALAFKRVKLVPVEGVE